MKVGLSIATPRNVGDRIFVTSFYNGPRMLEVGEDGKSAKILWQGHSDSEIKTDGLHSIIPTPVFDGNYIYGVCSYGQLRCLDAKNGKRVWETYAATGKGRWWNAFLIPHEDKYFIHNEQGDLIIARLSPEGLRGNQPGHARRADPRSPAADDDLVASRVRHEERVCPQRQRDRPRLVGGRQDESSARPHRIGRRSKSRRDHDRDARHSLRSVARNRHSGGPADRTDGPHAAKRKACTRPRPASARPG